MENIYVLRFFKINNLDLLPFRYLGFFIYIDFRLI